MPELNDQQFMEKQTTWPQWPALPIKRVVEGKREVGILWADGKPTVYLVNMWNLPADLTTAEHIDYPSFKEVVDAGWVVD